jgi:CxxC motif-containing protein
MNTKKITCIECPEGCLLSIDYEGCKAVKVRGAKCPKGIAYGITEIEDPTRILTSAVLAEGLDIKMVPVRTNKPIPKKDILRAMEEIKKVRVKDPVRTGQVIIPDLLGLGVKIIATREANKM